MPSRVATYQSISSSDIGEKVTRDTVLSQVIESSGSRRSAIAVITSCVRPESLCSMRRASSVPRGLPRTCSWTATIVSAAIASAGAVGAGRASALERARRSARGPGGSPGRGVSSMSTGRTVNSRPARRRSSERRGDAETSTIERGGIGGDGADPPKEDDQGGDGAGGPRDRQPQDDAARESDDPQVEIPRRGRADRDAGRKESRRRRVGERLADDVAQSGAQHAGQEDDHQKVPELQAGAGRHLEPHPLRRLIGAGDLSEALLVLLDVLAQRAQ